MATGTLFPTTLPASTIRRWLPRTAPAFPPTSSICWPDRPLPDNTLRRKRPFQADAIGKVEKVVGHATVMRNGTAVALNVGDAVYKSDVIQTGVNSSVGIAFPDGTAPSIPSPTPGWR